MLCVRCCANEKFPFSSSLTISHSAVATEYFMWSSHTFYTHSGERNSANFTPIWAEKQQQSAGKAQFMRFTENIKIYDLIYIHHPANIANRERKLHSSPNNINTYATEESKCFSYTNFFLLFSANSLLPVGWAAADFSTVAVASVGQQQVEVRRKLTFQAVAARRLSSNLSKINKRERRVRFCGGRE